MTIRGRRQCVVFWVLLFLFVAPLSAVSADDANASLTDAKKQAAIQNDQPPVTASNADKDAGRILDGEDDVDCTTADTCEDCLALGEKIPDTDDTTCLWKDDECQAVNKDDVGDDDKKCSKKKKNEPLPKASDGDGDGDDDGDSPAPTVPPVTAPGSSDGDGDGEDKGKADPAPAPAPKKEPTASDDGEAPAEGDNKNGNSDPAPSPTEKSVPATPAPVEKVTNPPTSGPTESDAGGGGGNDDGGSDGASSDDGAGGTFDSPTDPPVANPPPVAEPTEPASSPETAPVATPPAPTPTSTTSSSLVIDDDEGGALGAILGLIFLLGCGVLAYVNRHKFMNFAAPGDRHVAAKYHEVASDEDDEEWGWGDDDNDIGAGQVEMAPSFNGKDDGSVHKRRNPSGEFSTSSASPPTPLYGKSPSGGTKVAHTTMEHIPRLPKTVPAAPNSGGLSLQSGGGMSGMGGTPTMTTAKTTPKGMSLSKPKQQQQQPTSLSISNPAPSSMGGVPQRISSLGSKKPAAPPKKTPPPQPSPEDDIFASMGLSAKPTFHHATTNATSFGSTPRTPYTGSRWNTPTSTTATSSSSPFAGAVTSSVAPPRTAPAALVSPPVAAAVATAGSFDDDGDDNWDDDGDLDDLLND